MNNLADFLFLRQNELEKIKTKSQKAYLMIENKSFVLKLLEDETSIKNQVQKFNDKVKKEKLSSVTYIKYLNLYFNDAYLEYQNKNSFMKYQFHAIAMIVNEDKNIKEVYEYMIKKGKLRHSPNSNIYCNFEYFNKNMKKLISELKVTKKGA
ncbi:hypothetical protein [Halarcobacter anaerophilus]|uniref:Uncharacterized protein n=1 Tax=Halarcobacter anaerophilus TaxID=877500 RepID=A0A4Q0XZ33_9BACT|nr:hypothetical protein [Halarcobacter anaerophilus]QDF29920.1 hypothetical protein AANAER_2464 [Halarcobacter anaerophilus]RXJ62882.1 hypothetical protein CRV06_08590 [Halarcobacter anaerophilus]